jgi:hypothetical protein
VPAPSLSAVERHPQYERILKAMTANQTDQQIAAWVNPRLDRTTLWRFRKNKLQPMLQQRAQGPAMVAQALQDAGIIRDAEEMHVATKAVMAATAASAAADPLLARIMEHQRTLDAAIGFACDHEDPKSVAACVATDLKGLELHARLTGRLESQQGPSVAIQIVCPAQGNAPTVTASDDGITIDIGSK